MKTRWIIGITIMLALVGVASVAGAGTFDSGSQGQNGPLPPGALPATTNTMVLDLNTGVVTYYNGSTQLGSAPLLNIPPGGFPDGVLRLSTITIPATPVNVTLKFLRNTTNTPVTLLTQGDATIAGTIDISGSPGAAAAAGTATFANGGAGGPGGHAGGAGATNVPTTSNTRGGTGAGPGAGGAGAFSGSVYLEICAGGGGGFGTAGAAGGLGLPGRCDATQVGAGGPAYGTAALLPLLGGSGGGGAGGFLGCTGASGGGGGGALLIASSGTLTLTGSINANGGAGGAGANVCGSVNVGGAGGGAGGGVRLVATAIAGSGGQIAANGGGGGAAPPSGSFPGGNGGPGRIRVEAYNFTARITFSTTPSLTQPGTVALAGNPTLTITTIHTVSVPAAPTGSYATPDVILPANTPSTVNVVVGASNIPMGTQVTVRVTPEVGAILMASGNLPNPPVSVTVPVASFPLDQPFVVDAQATFQLGAWLDSPIKYAGEDVATATVMASLGGPSQVRYFTASGKQVPAEALSALGLSR